MKKIFLSFLILILISSASFAQNDFNLDSESEAENHKIIGGLYSLAAAVELNEKTNPDINSLVRFFERIPPGWQNEIKIENNKKSIWVGISVAGSSARRYLRSNAKRLGILENPGGSAWLGSEFAWLKAADIVKKKIKPVEFSAAESDGIIFFGSDESDSFFAAWPNFTASSIKKILAAHGTENHPELKAPKVQENQRVSIYDEVRPSSVRVPDKMHVGTKKSSFDMSMEVGDVIFNPIPNVHR